MSRLTRDGTAEVVSRDQILGRERGHKNGYFPCSADHEQDWQSYQVDPCSCYLCDLTYIHTYMGIGIGIMFVESCNRVKELCHKEVLTLQPFIQPKCFDIFSPLTGGRLF